jgi:hypothetical protein
VHRETDAIDPLTDVSLGWWYTIQVRVDPSEFISRTGKDKDGLVVREATVQDGLKDVVDHSAMITNDRPNIDPLDGASRSGIQFALLSKVVGEGALQTGGRRYQHQNVDVEPSVTEDHRSG